MSRTYIISAAALVAALLGALGYFIVSDGWLRGDRFAQCRATNVAGGAGAIGGPFQLMDHTGRAVTDADVFTRPSIMYFGYTFCPDVCPIDVDRNAIAVDILHERGYDAQPVFVSVDPQRDTPEFLSVFVENMHPDMIGLTGTEEEVRAAARAYRAFYQRQPGQDDDYYLIDHSTFSYLVLPAHGFVEVFRRDLSPDDMASTVSCFIDAAR